MERIKYRCNSCSYEFTRKADVAFKHCPYCGKQGTVEVNQGNFAEQMVGTL